MYSANLLEFHAYWIPSRNTFIGRSTSCVRRFAIPAEAQFIGFFSHPFLASDFFSDLDDVPDVREKRRALSAARA